MKYLLVLFFGLLISCESYFSPVPEGDQIAVDIDNEGDPIIPVIPDPETHTLGVENSYCYGFDTPSSENIAVIDINTDLPPSFDLSSSLPEIGSQGRQGSCVAWATGYYLKSFQENLEDIKSGTTAPNNQMSPAFVYNQIKLGGSCAGGSQIPTALDLISNDGITTLQEMPYNENECDTQPTDDQNTSAQNNKIASYAYLDGDILFDQTKAFLLNNQPVVIAISIDRQYFGAIDENGDSIYRKFKNPDGAHAMLVVGYDDAKNAFKVVNSWGSEWGNGGFVWIDYKAFKEVLDTNSDFKILCEAWVSEDIIN